MKFYIGALALCAFFQQSYAADDVYRIRMLSEVYADKCFYHTDYTYCADNTEQKIVEKLGGRETYIDRLQSLNNKKSVFEFIYTLIDKPGPVKRIGGLNISIVPIHNIVFANKRLMHVDAYLMAMSSDNGENWKFADFNNKVLANVYPELIGKISPEMLLKHRHPYNESAIHRVGIENFAERLAGPQPKKGKIEDRRYIAENGAFSIMLPYRLGWYRTVVTSEQKDGDKYSIVFQSPDTRRRNYKITVRDVAENSVNSGKSDILEHAFENIESEMKVEMKAKISIIRNNALTVMNGFGKYWKLMAVIKGVNGKVTFLVDVSIARSGNHLVTIISYYNIRSPGGSEPLTIKKILKLEKEQMDGFVSTNTLLNSIKF